MTRTGMSLLEVLIAMAILLLALVGIGRLIGLSTDRAELVRQQSQAALRCQSKLAELTAGVAPMQAGSGTFGDDPSWTYSVTAEPRDEAANLWYVQVRVVKDDSTGTSSMLSQLVVDPRYRGGVASAAPFGSENPDAPANDQKGKGGQDAGKDKGGSGKDKGGPRQPFGKGDFPPPNGKDGLRPPPGFDPGKGFKQ